jgi:hypothetical protein
MTTQRDDLDEAYQDPVPGRDFDPAVAYARVVRTWRRLCTDYGFNYVLLIVSNGMPEHREWEREQEERREQERQQERAERKRRKLEKARQQVRAEGVGL